MSIKNDLKEQYNTNQKLNSKLAHLQDHAFNLSKELDEILEEIEILRQIMKEVNN